MGADGYLTRLFDPVRDTHYGMSEEVRLEMEQLIAALEAIGTLSEAQPREQGSMITGAELAPLFYTLARHGQRILEDIPTIYAQNTPEVKAPAQRRKSA